MSGNPTIQLYSDRTGHSEALRALSIGRGKIRASPFQLAVHSYRNYALMSNNLKLDETASISNIQSLELSWRIDPYITGDLLNGLYLQINVPSLQKQKYFLNSYVWCLGYAIWSQATFEIDAVEIEKIYSIHKEMMDELFGDPGRLWDTMVFKIDSCSLPDLEKISTTRALRDYCMTLHIPLNFWFSKGQPLSLNINNNKRMSCKIKVLFRALDEISFSLPKNSASTQVNMPRISESQDLDWSAFDISLWANTVLLEREEIEETLRWGPTLVETCQSFTNDVGGMPLDSQGRIDRELPFRGILKSLVWAIGDDSRNTRDLALGTNNDPYFSESGIRTLFGERKGHIQTIPDRTFQSSQFNAVSYAQIKSTVTDWNAKASGTSDLDAFTPGEFAIVPVYTTSDSNPINTEITIRMPTGELLGKYAIQLDADNTIVQFQSISTAGIPEISPPPSDYYPIAINGYYPLFKTQERAQSYMGSVGTSHTHTFNGTEYHMPGQSSSYTGGLATLYHGNFTSYVLNGPSTDVDRKRKNHACIALTDIIGGEKLRGILMEEQSTATSLFKITPDNDGNINFNRYAEVGITFTDSYSNDISRLFVAFAQNTVPYTGSYGFKSYAEIAEHFIYTEALGQDVYDQIILQRSIDWIEDETFGTRAVDTPTSNDLQNANDTLRTAGTGYYAGNFFGIGYVDTNTTLTYTYYAMTDVLNKMFTGLVSYKMDPLTLSFFSICKYVIQDITINVNGNTFVNGFISYTAQNIFYILTAGGMVITDPSYRNTSPINITINGLGSGLAGDAEYVEKLIGTRAIHPTVIEKMNKIHDNIPAYYYQYYQNLLQAANNTNASSVTQTLSAWQNLVNEMPNAIRAIFDNDQSHTEAKTIYTERTIDSDADFTNYLIQDKGFEFTTSTQKALIRTIQNGSTPTLNNVTRLKYEGDSAPGSVQNLTVPDHRISVERMSSGSSVEGSAIQKITNIAVSYNDSGGVQGVRMDLPTESGTSFSLNPVIDISADLSNIVDSVLGVKPMNVQLTTAGLESISNVFALLSPIRYYITSSSPDIRFDVVTINQAQLQASTIPAEYVAPSSEDGLGNTIPTNNDIRVHRNDGQLACPFLHMNRFDYRATSSPGVESASTKTVELKLNNIFRWNSKLAREASYFNEVIPYERGLRLPRKGIYFWSFAKDPKDIQPSGHINLDRINSKHIVLQANASSSDYRGHLFMYANTINVFDPQLLAFRY